MLINLTELFSVDGKRDYTCDIDINRLCTSKAMHMTSYHAVRSSCMSVILGTKSFFSPANAEVTLQMPCDRCLEPVDIPFELEFDEESGHVKEPKASVQKISMNSPM